MVYLLTVAAARLLAKFNSFNYLLLIVGALLPIQVNGHFVKGLREAILIIYTVNTKIFLEANPQDRSRLLFPTNCLIASRETKI